jgi:hypothetical protein
LEENNLWTPRIIFEDNIKTHLKISVCEGVEIFKPVSDILLSRAGLSGTTAVAR